ncbi:hypothetical protein F4779DRAFT_636613 [Xylariaceae sp. FL0662B]|nr:hypothetical protein F4779DRAFT_636613 [Xylariaceae sp. FL0662B]
MAHSPLLRTVMRVQLDNRSGSLVSYELALEQVCIDLQQPPNKRNFDEDRWTECRKDYENKKEREAQQKEDEEDFITAIKRERRYIRSSKKRSKHFFHIYKMWDSLVPKISTLKTSIAKSGYAEWRPRQLVHCLIAEQDLTSRTHSRVCVGDQGLLDRRLLHQALSPRFVPKPHFKFERRRLEAKSAEFATFVEQQKASQSRKRIIIPRPEDDSSDEGLLTASEIDEVVKPGAAKGKRKRATVQKKARTRKPAKFVKVYDSKVHDGMQLKAQTQNRFCLMQQRQPRVESPALEVIFKKASDRNSQPPMTVDMDEEELALQQLRINGIKLPIPLPGSRTDEDGTPQQPTEDDVALYRKWRSRKARSFFNDRDRYIQQRMYRERATDRELSRASQALQAFWAKIPA